MLEVEKAPLETVEPNRARPGAESRELYRLSEVRFAEGDRLGAVAMLEASLEVIPDDVDPMLRHQLEARLTHMQLTAWQEHADLRLVLAARQRLFSRMSEFPRIVASLTPEQADTMRNELFEQLSDVEAQLEHHLGEFEGESEASHAAELAVLEAVAEAEAPRAERARDEPSPGHNTTRRSADGSLTREITVRPLRQSPFDDARAEARFNSEFASQDLLLTRTPELVHGPRGLVRVVRADDGTGRGVRRRARRLIADHRRALVRCYEAAFAREPSYGVLVDVSLRVTARAVEEVELTRGALMDEAGNRCLLEALGAMTIEREHAAGRISMGLLFLLQRPAPIGGTTGDDLLPRQIRPKVPNPNAVSPYEFAPASE